MRSRSIKNDRSGISTMVAVLAVVIIIVIAAAAAYVVLSNDDEETKTIAPGTIMNYDATSSLYGEYALEEKVIGQNADELFLEVKSTIGGITMLEYMVASKNMPEDAVKTGTEDIETMDGLKTLDVWEYTTEASGLTLNVKSYDDSSTGVTYRHEASTTGYSEVQNLTYYELVLQTSYEESENIGKTYKYVTNIEGTDFDAEIVCYADCFDDQYGIMFDLKQLALNKLYLLSDYVGGLPSSATDTEVTATLTDTIDGEVEVEIWQLTLIDSSTWDFYFEPESQVIYQFDVTAGGITYTFDLTEKPA